MRKINQKKMSPPQKQRELDLRNERYANLNIIGRENLLLKPNVRFDEINHERYKKKKIYGMERFNNLDD